MRKEETQLDLNSFFADAALGIERPPPYAAYLRERRERDRWSSGEPAEE